MKILIVNKFDADKNGGGEVHSKHLARLFAQQHEVLLVSLDRRPGLADYTVLRETYIGLDIYRIIKNNPAPFDDLHDPLLYQQFKRLVDVFQPDIIHFGTLNGYCASLVDIAKISGKKSVFFIQDFWWMCSQINRFKKDKTLCMEGPMHGLNCVKCNGVQNNASVFRDRVRQSLVRLKYRLLAPKYPALIKDANLFRAQYRDTVMHSYINLVDRLIVPSQFVFDEFLRWGIAEHKIEKLTWGVQLSGDRPEAADLCNRGLVTFGYIGRIEKYKGVEILLRAFVQLDLKHARLILCGPCSDPAYESHLKKNYQAANIVFHDAVPNELIRSELQHMDIVIIPSLFYETFNIVAREAQYLKIPIVVSDLGALPEAVESGQTGYTFKAGSVEELLAVLRKLVENHDDIDRLKKNIGPVKTMEEHARELLTLYAGMLSRSERS